MKNEKNCALKLINKALLFNEYFFLRSKSSTGNLLLLYSVKSKIETLFFVKTKLKPPLF